MGGHSQKQQTDLASSAGLIAVLKHAPYKITSQHELKDSTHTIISLLFFWLSLQSEKMVSRYEKIRIWNVNSILR